MGFLERLASAAGYTLTRDRDMYDPRAWGDFIRASAAGVDVTESEVLQLGIVQAIQVAVAGPVSTLPLKVFERMPDGNRREASDHPVHSVLHRAAGRRTAQELREAMAMDLVVRRECFAEIVPADGAAVGGLDYIEPWRVLRVEEGPDGRVYYRIAGRGTAPSYALREDEIWHTRRPPFDNKGLRGKPMWESARETFGYAIAIRRYGATWFKNSGRGGDVLSMPTGSVFKSKEEEEVFLANWKRGGRDAHSARLLKYGITRETDVANNNEAQFIESDLASKTEICGLWSMPLHKVGLLDKAIKASVEQQSIDFVLYTLAPYIVGAEQSAARDLLIGPEQDRYYIEHNVSGLLRGDIKTRYAAYAQGRQWGWLSVNDIRRMENLDGIGEAGDRYLEPVNMVEAGEGADPSEDVDPNEDDQP